MSVLRMRFTVRWVAATAFHPRLGKLQETLATQLAAEIAADAINSTASKTGRRSPSATWPHRRIVDGQGSQAGRLCRTGHRRNVGFRELWDHPEDYRGALLDFHSLCCRRVDSSDSKLGAAGELHEIWITLPEGELTPFACIAERLPDGFPNNAASSEPVVFVGYFLKVMAYDSGASRTGATRCSSASWSASPAIKTPTRSIRSKRNGSPRAPVHRSWCLARKSVSRSVLIKTNRSPLRTNPSPAKTWLESLHASRRRFVCKRYAHSEHLWMRKASSRPSS